MSKISVQNACVDFPMATIRGISLKSIVLARASAIGGRIVSPETRVSTVRSLDNLSFTLKSGDRLGLIGPNGAGKTTLIRLLSGIYAPSSGSVAIEGKSLPLFDIALGMDDEMTGYENIRIRGLMMGMSNQDIDGKLEDIAAFSDLGPYLHLPMRTYSSGMILRLMFSIATSISGDIVLMDEWIAVGDKDFRVKAQERLEILTRKSGILVLASHDASLLRQVCNIGLHLSGGQIQKFGPIDEVLAHAGYTAGEAK